MSDKKTKVIIRNADQARAASEDFYKKQQLDELMEVMEKIQDSCSSGLYITTIDKVLTPELERVLEQSGYIVRPIPVTGTTPGQWNLHTHISWERRI